MYLIELLNHLLNALDLSCTLDNLVQRTYTCKNPLGVPLYDELGGILPGGIGEAYESLINCPSYALTPIAAAFATQGYWVQSDIIHWLMATDSNGYATGMGFLAPLAYMLSAVAGLVSMGLGQPPRQYLWFFAGPAIFSWLIGTPSDPIVGVQWRTGGQDQDMRQVWKLAEPGLVNSNIYRRLGQLVPPISVPYIQVPLVFDDDVVPGVRVSFAFAWYDAVLSEVIDETIRWLGVFKTTFQSVVSDFLGSDLSNLPPGVSGIAGVLNQPIGWNPDTSKSFLLSNLKWGILHDITDAQVNDPDLRNSLTSFMNSECFDALKDNISKANFEAAALGKPQTLPRSVFKCSLPGGAGCDTKADFVSRDVANADWIPDNVTGRTYRNVFNALKSIAVPTPDWLKSFVGQSEAQPGSFTSMFAIGAIGASGDLQTNLAFEHFRNGEEIYCSDFLALVISGFRWEAGHNYANIARDGPDMFGAESVWCTDYMAALPHTLFYGWDVKRCLAYNPVDGKCLARPHKLNRFENINFIQDLVLLSMLKNELRWMPPAAKDRYSESQKTVQNAQSWQRTSASQSKFGELYSWALMVPYFQGILLYLLAIGYPFACIMVVVPGMHRAIITWATFWAWAKMWDVGFAIAMSMERSVWGMIGNSSNSAQIFQKVLDMQNWATTQVGCPTGATGTGFSVVDHLKCMQTGTHAVRIGGALSVPGDPGLFKYDLGSGDALAVTSLKILDRAMVLASSMDLDLANSYYIYIMSAMYFAVPAVTGQLVLGAKAGASGLINSAMGSNAQESGRGANAAWSGEQQTRAGNTAQVANQAQLMKSARMSGLMSNADGTGALDRQNQGALLGLAARAADTASTGLGYTGQNLGATRDIKDSSINLTTQAGQVGLNWASELAGGKGIGDIVNHGRRALGGPGDTPGQSLTSEVGNANSGSSAAGSQAVAGGDPGGGATRVPGLRGGNTSGGGKVNTPTGAALNASRGPVAKGFSMLSDAVGVVGAAAMFENRDKNFQYQSGIMAQQGALGLDSMVNSQQASGLNSHAGRLQQGAAFQAETGRFRGMQSWGEGSVSRLAGAMGMSSGVTSAGSLSNNLEGAAMSGMLGGWNRKDANGNTVMGANGRPVRDTAKSNANYFNPMMSGGFKDTVNATGAYVGSNYIAPIAGAYVNTNPANAKSAENGQGVTMLNGLQVGANSNWGYNGTPAVLGASPAEAVSGLRNLTAPAPATPPSSGGSGKPEPAK